MGKLNYTHLQMRPDKGLLPSVVKVVPHQEVEQLGGLGSDGAQLGVAELQDLVAQSSTHVSSPFIERRGKLGGARESKQPSHGQCAPHLWVQEENAGQSMMTSPMKELTL